MGGLPRTRAAAILLWAGASALAVLLLAASLLVARLLGAIHASPTSARAARLSASVVRVRAVDLLRPWGRSHGTGFVWDAEGHIVTNFHVVRRASFLAVEFADGEERRARVLAGAPECDLAVLALLEGEPARVGGAFGGASAARAWRPPPPLRLATKSPRPGEHITTVGHPGHWSLLVGEGVVSGIGRRASRLLTSLHSGGGIRTFQRKCSADGFFVTTAAAAGPGSSGGPVLSSSGNVLGLTTWQFSGGLLPTVHVAIGTEVLQRVVPDLLRHGSRQEPWVGIEGCLGHAGVVVPRRRANALLGLRVQGVRLLGLPRGHARRAGLRCFDELLRVGGTQVEHPADALAACQRAEPNQVLPVLYRRPGDPRGHRRRADVRVASLGRRGWRQWPRRLLVAALRAYVTARVLHSVGADATGLRDDVPALLRVVRALLTNESGWARGAAGTLHYAARLLLSPPENACGAFKQGKACLRVPGSPQPSHWPAVKTAAACHRKCEGRSIDGSMGCCSFSAGAGTCELFPSETATVVLKKARWDHAAALCQAMHAGRAEARAARLWGLLRSFVLDS